MKRIFNQLLELGRKEDLPKYLSRKVLISNALAIAVALLIGIPYVILSYIHFQPLIWIPAIATVICAIVLLLNYYNQIYISRVIIGALPLLMAMAFIGYLWPAGSILLFESYVVAVAFAIVPFLVFDIREKVYVAAFSLFIVVLFVFGLDWVNAVFELETELDVSVISDGYLGQLNTFLGMVLVITGILVLSYQNFRSDMKAEHLMKEMGEQTEEIRRSETELKEKIKQIEINQAEEKKRNWATEGIAEISTILRSDQSGHELYDKITSYITKYLDANQCGLFTVVKDEHNDSDVRIVLQSAYAYDRKKFVDKEIEPGQGLVGQAYLEQSTIYLKDVPDGYVSITSGMGEHTASEVLIVPLVVNEEVEGVLEFASFNHFKDYQIQFVEHLGETLASFISINRINERTKYLLEESQQQTEEMRAQEEEMRQNMEELAATQEEMGRKEQEYISRIRELEAQLGES